MSGIVGVNEKVPFAPATAVPRTAAPLKTVTVLPASAVPVRVGVVSAVAAVPAVSVGARGAVRSITVEVAVDRALTLPAGSVAVAVRV